jgi:hypothetical protein
MYNDFLLDYHERKKKNKKNQVKLKQNKSKANQNKQTNKLTEKTKFFLKK